MQQCAYVYVTLTKVFDVQTENMKAACLLDNTHTLAVRPKYCVAVHVCLRLLC